MRHDMTFKEALCWSLLGFTIVMTLIGIWYTAWLLYTHLSISWQ